MPHAVGGILGAAAAGAGFLALAQGRGRLLEVLSRTEQSYKNPSRGGVRPLCSSAPRPGTVPPNRPATGGSMFGHESPRVSRDVIRSGVAQRERKRWDRPPVECEHTAGVSAILSPRQLRAFSGHSGAQGP